MKYAERKIVRVMEIMRERTIFPLEFSFAGIRKKERTNERRKTEKIMNGRW